MLKNILKFYFNRVIFTMTTIVTIVFAVGFLYVSVDAFKDGTWIYSASMQTLATLIALLPISYGYYISNIDNEQSEEYDSYVIDRLKTDVYNDMMSVIFFSIIVILVNLVSFFIDVQGMFTYVVAYLTTLSIVHICVYIYRLFNPNKVREILKEFDVVSPTSQMIYISLDQFITEYLELEGKVKDLITSEQNSELLSTTPLYDIVDLYSKDYPQISNNYDKFKEIIFHRNNVIHNYSDTQIDYSKYMSLLELKDMFTQYNNQFVQKTIFRNVLSVKTKIEGALKEVLYDTTLEKNDVEEEVLSTLHSHFISDYYKAVSDVPNSDIDFAIIQNNYSEFKLVGIEIKSVDTKDRMSISKAFFNRFDDRYLYLFSVYYIPKTKVFEVYYQTKDKEIRRFVVKEGN